MRSRSMDPFIEREREQKRPSAEQAMAMLRMTEEKSSVLRKLEGLKKDDYILIGIIAVLFFEGSEDYILLAALGYLFVMGIL